MIKFLAPLVEMETDLVQDSQRKRRERQREMKKRITVLKKEGMREADGCFEKNEILVGREKNSECRRGWMF